MINEMDRLSELKEDEEDFYRKRIFLSNMDFIYKEFLRVSSLFFFF